MIDRVGTAGSERLAPISPRPAGAAWCSAAVSLLGALLFLLFYKEGGAVRARREAPLPPRQLIRTVGENPRFWPVLRLGIAAAAAFAALPAGVPAPLAAAALVLFGIFGIGWFPLYLLDIAEMAPRSSIASTVSFASTLCLIAMALGPWLFGLVADRFGYPGAWTLLIAPVVVTALPLLGSRTRPAGP